MGDFFVREVKDGRQGEPATGACPGMGKDRCARSARANSNLFVKLRHFRHYYRGALSSLN